MRPSPLNIGALVNVTLGLVATESARAQFDALVKHIPNSANNLVLVNAEKMFNSPVAKSEGWQQIHSKRFVAGPTNPRADG